jgi:hypothetical protein
VGIGTVGRIAVLGRGFCVTIHGAPIRISAAAWSPGAWNGKRENGKREDETKKTHKTKGYYTIMNGITA